MENSDRLKIDCNHSLETLSSEQKVSIAPIIVAVLVFIVEELVSCLIFYAFDKIMQQIFPDENINFDQLREEMSKTVSGITVEQTVQEQEGIINGLLDYLKFDYSTSKDANVPKSELYEMLRGQIPTLRESLNILSRPLFEKNGFPAYIAGSVLLISLYTEMSLQDPFVKDYTKSGNVNIL